MPGEQQAVSLPLVAVGGFVSILCGFNPFFLGPGVLGNDTEFAVQDADAVLDRNGIAGDGVIATEKIGCFATGDLQADVFDIIQPGLPVNGWERNRRLFRDPSFVAFLVERTFVAAEPRFVDQVVLGVADPGRGEDLAFVAGTGLLFFFGLADARLDDTAVRAIDGLKGNLPIFRVGGAEVAVIVRRPEDVGGLAAGFRATCPALASRPEGA